MAIWLQAGTARAQMHRIYYDPLCVIKAIPTTVNGVTYYFYGYMRTDFVAVENGIFYYFGSDGALESERWHF